METKKYNLNGTINQQWLSEEVARLEGKKEEVDIGQIKEIQKIILEILSEFYEDEVLDLIYNR